MTAQIADAGNATQTRTATNPRRMKTKESRSIFFCRDCDKGGDEMQPEYWVEARTTLHDNNRLMSYGVHHINAKGARECVKRFSVNRKGGWEVALYLANTLRDDLNAVEQQGR
jgi:hypothetical protein